MYKQHLPLIGLLLLLVTNVFAQSGSFTVTSPCNSYNRGEFIWSFTWAKQTSPHPGIKLSYTLRPGNTFRLGSRTFTRSEVGFSDGDIRNVSVTSNFSFDVYYKGAKVGTVGTGKYLSSSGLSGWLTVEGDYTLFVTGVSYEQAKSIFLSEIEVKNFRFQENAGVEFQFSDNLLAKLKQQEEAGKPQNNNQQKKEEEKSSSSQSQSSGTGTGSSGSNSNNNNYGQQVYNQTLENNKQIQQNTANANQAIHDATTAIWGTAEERKAKSDAEYAAWEKKEKAKQEAEDRESMRRQQATSIDFGKRMAAYHASDFSTREQRYRNLANNAAELDKWVQSCKNGTKASLGSYLAAYPGGYFAEVAQNMMLAWDNGKSQPNAFIKLAVMECNWPLTKFLLDAGARVEFNDKDPYGHYHSAIRQLLEPYYTVEQRLQYLETDRDKLLQQMILQGADPNKEYDEKYYAGETEGYEYIIDIIIRNDYNGTTLSWLLENRKLTAKTIQNAFLKLVFTSPADYSILYKYKYENACKVHNYLTPRFTGVDEYFIETALLVKYGAPLSGTFPHPASNKLQIGLSVRTNTESDRNGFYHFHEVPEGLGSFDNFTKLQTEIVKRITEVSTNYLPQLAGQCIMSHNITTDKNGNLFDAKPVLTMLINAGINPKQNSILWWFKGQGQNYYSMVSLARELNPSLVDFLKNAKANKAAVQPKETTNNSDIASQMLNIQQLMSAGKFKEAKGEIDAFMRQNAGLANSLYEIRGTCNLGLKNYEEALDDFEKGLRELPNDIGLLNGAAWTRALLKKELNTAETQILQALKQSPNNYGILDTYGFIQYQQGRWAESKLTYEKSLTLGGDRNGTIMEHYGDVLLKLGDKEGALAQWKKAKALGGDLSDDIDSKINGSKPNSGN